MNRNILITMMALGIAGPAAAQSGGMVAGDQAAKVVAEQNATAKREMQAVGEVRARMGVEAKITKGAPYSAEAITESIQALPDGNRINHKSTTRVYRDGEGRTRREQLNDDGVVVSASIVDPIANTSFVLQPETRTAFRQNSLLAMPAMAGGRGRSGGAGGAMGGGGGRGGAVMVTPLPADKERAEVELRAQADRKERTEAAVITALPTMKAAMERTSGEMNREDLGTQTVEGVAATGTRMTTTIPAGAIGNDQVIKVVSEQWFSPDLQVLVMTKHSDPRSGDTTYRLANIVRAEPDHSLFSVPPDYTLKESGIRTPLGK